MRKLLISLVAAALVPGAWAAPGRGGESADKHLVREMPEGHREVVKSRQAAKSSGPTDSDHKSSRHGRGRLVDDDDDDRGSLAADIFGALVSGLVGSVVHGTTVLVEGDHRPADAAPRREVRGSGPAEHRMLFDDEEGAGAESGWSASHPWLAAGGGEGLASRINLGVTRYDNRRLHEAANYEYQIYGRLVGTWGLGLLVGGGFGSNAATGSITRGDLETGLVMATTSVDIPLGDGYAPVLSLGGGFGGFYIDPQPAKDIRDDLDALGLELDEGHHWYPDWRVRADLLFPLDRSRHGYVALGAARDWSSGTVETRMRDQATGATVSRDSQHMSFDRTIFQLSLVIIF